ncbi:MAG: DUF488 family protein [Anaerovoracaceae bacterium]
MQIYTIGFTQKTAEQFFETIRQHGIQIVVDVRLNNQSQLAGFTKGRDLGYFLKVICSCRYAHEEAFAPTKEILDAFKKDGIDWTEYERRFDELFRARKMTDVFKKKYLSYDRVLLLCSEATPKHCHRRLLAEKFAEELHAEIIHL